MCTVRPSGATLSGVRSSTSPLKIRLDVVGERALRYWITAEPDIVHRVTPLLAGPVPTTPDAVSEEFDGGVTLRAAGASLHVEIPPIGGPMVRVLDRSGVEVGAVGGGEADLYGTWDSSRRGAAALRPRAIPSPPRCSPWAPARRSTDQDTCSTVANGLRVITDQLTRWRTEVPGP
jgi:hypothetical protein